MNKQMEFGFLIALGLLTTMSVGTLIHRENAKGKSIFDIAANDVMRQMGKWVHNHPSAAPVRGARQMASAPATARQVITSLTTEGLTLPLGWQKVMTDLSSSLSKTDWEHVLTQLLDENPKNAENTLDTLVSSHLSPQDKSWVESQFAGNTAISSEDGLLAIQTLDSLEQNLTPLEQHALLQMSKGK